MLNPEDELNRAADLVAMQAARTRDLLKVQEGRDLWTEGYADGLSWAAGYLRHLAVRHEPQGTGP